MSFVSRGDYEMARWRRLKEYTEGESSCLDIRTKQKARGDQNEEVTGNTKKGPG